ncbi:ferredoxin reductase [uncultured Microbacterium sp.]|uniref:ferredoxin reductase n=1 Tax=uncultured Microbacterium sp. TaxID=191216 RepID=UPI0028DD3405|nr:ferredoxin reductase [uncultured Microbacterium sp.]
MTGASSWRRAVVVAVRPAGSHGRVLQLRVDGWTGNLAGQHVDVRLTAEDGYQAVRSYSLASAVPGDVIEMAVDEVADGEVSPYLVEDVRPGDELEVRGPIGGYFVWTPAHAGPVQLIAGGSGIVPLLAIARAHAESPDAPAMRLLYSVRSPADAFYADELQELIGDAFAVDWAYTRSAPPSSTRPVGRIDEETIAAATLPPSAHPTVYVCGPTPFVEAVADLLVSAGHPPERIRTERFGGT